MVADYDASIFEVIVFDPAWIVQSSMAAGATACEIVHCWGVVAKVREKECFSNLQGSLTHF